MIRILVLRGWRRRWRQRCDVITLSAAGGDSSALPVVDGKRVRCPLPVCGLSWRSSHDYVISRIALLLLKRRTVTSQIMLGCPHRQMPNLSLLYGVEGVPASEFTATVRHNDVGQVRPSHYIYLRLGPTSLTDLHTTALIAVPATALTAILRHQSLSPNRWLWQAEVDN